jgi:hypothetical protein
VAAQRSARVLARTTGAGSKATASYGLGCATAGRLAPRAACRAAALGSAAAAGAAAAAAAAAGAAAPPLPRARGAGAASA